MPRFDHPAGEEMARLQIKIERLQFDLRETLRAVLHYFGPSGASKVTQHALRNHLKSDPMTQRTEPGLLMKYFVLKPAGGDTYAIASREAMRSYAQVIEGENPALAKELRAWVTREASQVGSADWRAQTK